MPTASEVMAVAKKQIGYKESPPNSNRTKYGRKFGMNGEPWCFIFEWWCGMRAAKKHGGSNPFPHSANAAYGQDDIVSKMGGTWVLKKTTSKQARKDALKRYRAGDCVDFDFGAYDAYRRHTGLVEKVVCVLHRGQHHARWKDRKPKQWRHGLSEEKALFDDLFCGKTEV